MTNKKTDTSMTKRWIATDAMEATNNILSAINNPDCRKIPTSPFGKISGLADFRGFPFNLVCKIKGKCFENIDLSASSFEGVWLQDCLLKSAKFDYANLGELKDHGNRFECCSFVKALFVGAGLGYQKTLYKECLFEATNFKKSTFIAARFQSCRFDKAKLKGIDFYASSFDSCAFLGRLENVWFRGGYPTSRDSEFFGESEPNLMRHVSFAEAELIGLNFTGGCDLSCIDMPKTSDYRLYGNWRNRLLRLSKECLRWSPAEQKEALIFVQSYLEASASQNWMLLNVSEISEEFGPTLAHNILASLDTVINSGKPGIPLSLGQS
jgi:hypothetical protein